MHTTALRACFLLAWVGVMAATIAEAAEPSATDAKPTAVTRQAYGATASVALPSLMATKPKRIEVPSPVIVPFGDTGRAAGTPPPGTTVYLNERDPINQFYNPGNGATLNVTIADDLELAGGACEVTYYSLAVYGNGFPYDVHVELWDDYPCISGAAPIPGTAEDFTNLPIGTVWSLDVTFDTPIPAPVTVWLAATFSDPNSGWMIGGKAETGITDDVFYQQGYCPGGVHFGGDPWAGFMATVNCNLQDPPGACCDGTACTEVAEAECTSGDWLGPFTTCDPSPCLPGACCTGAGFTSCTDTSLAECRGVPGLFHPETECAADPCGPSFMVYRNEVGPPSFVAALPNAKLADDQTLGPGAPCALSSFELEVFGTSDFGPYDVTAELWTDNPGDPAFPLAQIPGTTTVFTNLRDGVSQWLLAGPFTGIDVPEKVWMVISTSTEETGWLVGSQAVVGSTANMFARLLPEDETWSSRNIDNGDTWAGFRARVWCQGEEPVGACCNDASGTCIDGVTLLECKGRWMAGATCATDPFDPPCGTNACCTLYGCANMSISECETYGGASALGLFCADITCPRPECLSADGDCFSAHGTGGCDDAFCCEAICQLSEACCTSSWAQYCATSAQSACALPPPGNDHCANAEPIAGEGDFSFDNATASTDGPVHEACLDDGQERGIHHDVWYCWTSSCPPENRTAFVRTCGLTAVDTKLAAYDDCAVCPPGDANLLDCNDDSCTGGEGPQSQVTFDTLAGETYLIRVGAVPGADGGTGELRITCGPPDVPVCGSPQSGDCCQGSDSPGCSDESCCEIVCACDSFCCETEWDGSCATTGLGDSGCGAQFLCPGLCGCPDEPVTFLDPPDGVIDARQPHEPSDPGTLQGIDHLVVEGSAGMDDPFCWSLCETAVEGVPNDIATIVDNGDGTFTVQLVRSISTGAVTKVTYAAGGGMDYSATLISHPADVDALGRSNTQDILNVIEILSGTADPQWGDYSSDINHTNQTTSADILRVIDLLNGAEAFDPWSEVLQPDCAPCCP